MDNANCQQIQLHKWHHIILFNILQFIRFSISYLSIPGIVVNVDVIFPILLFFFSISMSCCTFHLCNCFSEGFKTGQASRGDEGRCGVIIFCHFCHHLMTMKVICWRFFGFLGIDVFLLVRNGIQQEALYFLWKQGSFLINIWLGKFSVAIINVSFHTLKICQESVNSQLLNQQCFCMFP